MIWRIAEKIIIVICITDANAFRFLLSNSYESTDMFKVQLFFFLKDCSNQSSKNSSSNANFNEAIVEFDDKQSLSFELSDIEEFAIDNHKISIEYDYGVEYRFE